MASTDMTDEQFINYCEDHCRTPRALFSADHINRIAALAGDNMTVHGWHECHEDAMLPWVKDARKRMRQPKLALVVNNG